jgi:hypothetical protein
MDIVYIYKRRDEIQEQKEVPVSYNGIYRAHFEKCCHNNKKNEYVWNSRERTIIKRNKRSKQKLMHSEFNDQDTGVIR